MAEATAQEKTEAPTVKRREDSRKEGMVAVSREVSSAALLGTFALYFVIAGQPTLASMEGLWKFSFANLDHARKLKCLANHPAVKTPELVTIDASRSHLFTAFRVYVFDVRRI